MNGQGHQQLFDPEFFAVLQIDLRTTHVAGLGRNLDDFVHRHIAFFNVFQDNEFSHHFEH